MPRNRLTLVADIEARVRETSRGEIMSAGPSSIGLLAQQSNMPFLVLDAVITVPPGSFAYGSSTRPSG